MGTSTHHSQVSLRPGGVLCGACLLRQWREPVLRRANVLASTYQCAGPPSSSRRVYVGHPSGWYSSQMAPCTVPRFVCVVGRLVREAPEFAACGRGRARRNCSVQAGRVRHLHVRAYSASTPGPTWHLLCGRRPATPAPGVGPGAEAVSHAVTPRLPIH